MLGCERRHTVANYQCGKHCRTHFLLWKKLRFCKKFWICLKKWLYCKCLSLVLSACTSHSFKTRKDIRINFKKRDFQTSAYMIAYIKVGGKMRWCVWWKYKRRAGGEPLRNKTFLNSLHQFPCLIRSFGWAGVSVALLAEGIKKEKKRWMSNKTHCRRENMTSCWRKWSQKNQVEA